MEQIVHVSGMTCGHCEAAVKSELGEVAGVSGVDVALHPDGVSVVSVHSDDLVPMDQIVAAIDEAGYEVVADQA